MEKTVIITGGRGSGSRVTEYDLDGATGLDLPDLNWGEVRPRMRTLRT